MALLIMVMKYTADRKRDKWLRPLIVDRLDQGYSTKLVEGPKKFHECLRGAGVILNDEKR